TWWTGIWLNEAFATFMEILAVDAWKPEWQRWTTFGVSRASALSVDGLRSTRPIEFPVEAPKDADAMFDVLTYEKGASVLRMLEQYIGPAVFRDGVRRYLGRHAYGNTEPADLWRAVGEAARRRPTRWAGRTRHWSTRADMGSTASATRPSCWPRSCVRSTAWRPSSASTWSMTPGPPCSPAWRRSASIWI